MLYPFELRAQIRQLQLQQGVLDNRRMGDDLLKCLHSPSIAQPLHDCESNRARRLGVAEVSRNP